jgi:hypothetical protein
MYTTNEIHENVTIEEIDENDKNLFREKSLMVLIFNSKCCELLFFLLMFR